MMYFNFFAVFLANFLFGGTKAQSPAALEFDPYAYKKTFAKCKAFERDGPQPVKVDLKLAYLDINPTAKKTLILLHGWPSLWTTYRHQIKGFENEYRLIVPDHRGYGDSGHPKDLYSSNAMFDVSDSHPRTFSKPTHNIVR
jgi:soluble epoxide hydrolase/lipid-phosphate phosphatase